MPSVDGAVISTRLQNHMFGRYSEVGNSGHVA
jgi:hypothetical protein